jgi:hypothetical protein
MKSNLTLIAIAVTAVVVIAGVAVFVLNNNSGESGDLLDKIPLPVYGNADGDNTVDNKDVELIERMIAEQIPLSEYPFADADRDDIITENDASIVRKLIAGENTKVTFIDQYDLVDKDEYRFVTVDYPLKNLVTQNADMLMLTMMIDADDKVAGYIANIKNYPNQFYKVTHNGVSQQIGTTARQIAAADWEGIKNLDVELHDQGGIGAILVHSKQALGDYEDDIIAAGFNLIFLRATDPFYSLDASILLGFLLGPDYSTKAKTYATDCKETIDELKDKTSKIAEKDRKAFISLCMVCYIAQDESQYTKLGTFAGGNAAVEIKGTTSVKLQDVEAITKYNDKIDYMLNCSTQDCAVITPDVLWEDQGCKYMAKSTHYQDMVWINMSMPVSCRVMYITSIFYPEIVSHADADDYFQSMVDKYMSYLNYTADDGDFDVREDMFTTITWQDYKEWKGDDPEDPIVSDINCLGMATHFFNAMDFAGYSGEPFEVSGNDQEASVNTTTGGNYYYKAKLYKDSKAQFEIIKKDYESKIGTQSPMGGTYVGLYQIYGLTDGIGYYVNTTGGQSSNIGAMHYAGYYKECVIEVKLAFKPSFTDEQLDTIIKSIWGTEGTISAIESAKKIDLTELSGFYLSPYALTDDSNKMYAKIRNTVTPESKDYHIIYDNSDSAFIEFEQLKITYKEKAAQDDYMGGKPKAIELNGFQDGAGFYGNTTKGFSMIQFAGYKDGTYVQIYLRMNDAQFDDDFVNGVVSTVAETIA